MGHRRKRTARRHLAAVALSPLGSPTTPLGAPMKQLLALLASVAAMLLPGHVLAESFMGIGPQSRLQDLRSLFPNASITDLSAAWLKPHQRLVDIAGSGIDGQLAVKLEHEVEGTRLLAKELAVRQARGTLESWQAWLLDGLPARIARLEASPPVDPWEVKDIRWQPPAPVPLQTASRRYGAPGSDTTDEQFRRVVEWKERGVTGYVNGDERIELFVFTFTYRDYVCANAETAPPVCDEPNATAPSQPLRKK